jgi:predicted tellurium resistance membrane protein TerC
MEWMADPAVWFGLPTLVLLEIVLGVDNLNLYRDSCRQGAAKPS